MDDLIAFLRANLLELAAPIRISAWHVDSCEDPEVEDGECIYCGAKEDPEQFSLLPVSDERLIDIAARRLIVDECENVGRFSEPASGTVILADKVLRLLALPLADAHGYNQDWRP